MRHVTIRSSSKPGRPSRAEGALREGGRPVAAKIQAYGRRWADACRAAGLPGVRVHDLRRSFAVEAKRRGVEDRVVMAIGGWKTRSVLDRYRIIDSTDLRDGMRKLGRPAPEHAQDAAAPATRANG